MTGRRWREALTTPQVTETLAAWSGEANPARLADLLARYEAAFGTAGDWRVFSAPGRAELCGNHTDHQQGCVVALAVKNDILAVASARSDDRVTILSDGFAPCRLSLAGECPPPGSSEALVYGVASALRRLGVAPGGFDCVTHSTLPAGAGFSSSAAFENLVATMLDELYGKRSLPPLQKALAGQWAENHCYGKPCGLMDQLASCRGGVSFMDFANPESPECRALPLPLEQAGYTLCALLTGDSHAGATDLYAAIPAEMHAVAAALGQPALAFCTKEQLLARLPTLRELCGDRALLRALNYFDEVERVHAVAAALQEGEVERLPALLAASAEGSHRWLQNVTNPQNPAADGLGLALYRSRALCPAGGFRPHGGGFGGALLGLVPTAAYPAYRAGMEALFGPGSCRQLHVRAVGGAECKLA